MAHEIVDNTPLKKTVTIKIAQEDLDRLVNKRLRKLQKTVKIHGFRKGKVPMSTMKQRYGGAAFQEALEEHLDRETQAILDEIDNVVFLGEQKIDRNKDGYFVSTIEVETIPDVDLTGYLGLEVESFKVEVKEEEVEEQLKFLQERFAVLEPVEDRKEIQIGDTVIFDFQPISKTVEEIEDSALTGKNINFTVVEEDEKNPKAINAALIGAVKDEPITVVVKLEELDIHEYGPEASCTLRLDVRSINNKVLPELNDDLALETGIKDTFDELVELIREQLKEQKNTRRRMLLREAVSEKLLELFPFELPPKYVEAQIDERLRENLRQMGLSDANNPDFDLNAMLPYFESARESLRETVVKNIRASFLANKVFSLEEMTVENEDFSKLAIEQAGSYNLSPNQFLEALSRDQNQARRFAAVIRVNKALDFVADNAEISEIDEELFNQKLEEKREAEIEKMKEQQEKEKKEFAENVEE